MRRPFCLLTRYFCTKVHLSIRNIFLRSSQNLLFIGLTQPDELTEDQKAVNHLAVRTIENHMAVAGFLWRYGYHMPEFYEKLCEPYYGSSRGLKFFRYGQGFMMKVKASFHGIGRHSIEEVADMANQDLKGKS